MRHVKLGIRNHGTRAGVACAGFFMPVASQRGLVYAYVYECLGACVQVIGQAVFGDAMDLSDVATRIWRLNSVDGGLWTVDGVEV